ncbi:MAG: ribosome maturation factor RimP [Clostridia bacterium]|nr:ribosome maturation factor RimP [Clostridia bacterium]
MASKGKGGSTVAAVQGLAQRIADELGLSIWDVTFTKEGATYYLRIFIDKAGGVGIEDCESFSRAIDAPLDELDPIEQGYCLEVCSPGVERSLTKPAHFTACLGQRVMVRMIRPIDGVRDFKGVLEDYDDGRITVRFDSGDGLTFTKKEAGFIKLDDFDTIES